MTKDKSSKVDQKAKALSDDEAKKAVGGAFTRAQYDRWSGMGPADRSNFGPGAGE